MSDEEDSGTYPRQSPEQTYSPHPEQKGTFVDFLFLLSGCVDKKL